MLNMPFVLSLELVEDLMAGCIMEVGNLYEQNMS